MEATRNEKMKFTAIEHLLERSVLLKKQSNMIVAEFLQTSLLIQQF